MKHLLFLSFIALLLVSCKKETAIVQNKVVFDGIDQSIKPGDDFFNHVNKNWLEAAVIADDHVGVGSYHYLNIPQKKLLQNILEDIAAGQHPEGSNEQKVGDFYASGMDTATINQRGFTPIQPVLDRIESIQDVPSMMAFVAEQLKAGDYSIIYPYVSPDQANSNINIVHFMQTGLGLPDRDYYFRNDSAAVGIQKAYINYVAALFELIGDANASKNATTVYDMEKQLAESHKTRIERRDVKANYNKVAVSEIDETHKNIEWAKLLSDLGITSYSVDINHLAYYKKIDTMLGSVGLANWKAYLKANSIISHANILSQDFEDAAFAYAKVLSGQSVQKSREELMVQNVDQQIGFALGQLYVKRYFNEDAKKRALELVDNLQKSLENRIEQLDWMSDSTKVKAKDKLHAITKKIGYPDVWRSYDEVKIEKGKYFENVVALRKNDYHYNLNKLNMAPDRNEWFTTPSTVTAYYNPYRNEIVFPAGILQSPYFDLNADDAVNYGGIGMVIGHEFTHAFDDRGAQFDKDGNVKNWWTDDDYEKFKAKTQQVIDRYSTFAVLDSVFLKGALTVGENTADNGGIAIAYDAFKMTQQGQDTTSIDGLTPDQRFFLSIARIWRVKTRDEFLRNYVATNPHSPPIWRVNGPLMNFTPFYEAFDVQPGDKNFKPESERIKIW